MEQFFILTKNEVLELGGDVKEYPQIKVGEDTIVMHDIHDIVDTVLGYEIQEKLEFNVYGELLGYEFDNNKQCSLNDIFLDIENGDFLLNKESDCIVLESIKNTCDVRIAYRVGIEEVVEIIRQVSDRQVVNLII